MINNQSAFSININVDIKINKRMKEISSDNKISISILFFVIIHSFIDYQCCYFESPIEISSLPYSLSLSLPSSTFLISNL